MREDRQMTKPPVMTEVWEWVLWFQDHQMTVAAMQQALVGVGRNDAPALLADLWAEGFFLEDKAPLVETIGVVWSMAEYPDRYLDHETWRILFELAGYTVDGKPADRPLEPIHLWRGSVPERRADWSWTDSREVAARYAAGTHYGRPKSVVWTALVEPDRLLARNTERDEAEYVVDTAGLEITEAEISPEPGRSPEGVQTVHSPEGRG